MVIGSRPQVAKSLFSLGDTLSVGIANEFAEASQGMHLSALFELGLVLMLVTLAFNLLAHLLIQAMGPRKATGG